MGSHVCVSLCEAGYKPIILDNFSNSSPKVMKRLKQITGEKIDLIKGDVLEPALLAQLFKDNKPVVDLVKNKLLVESINQYKIEERAIVVKRLLGSKNKIESLIESMKFDKISSDEKVNKLTQQIYFLTRDNSFKNLNSMGEVLEKSFNYLISNYENHEMLRINKAFWVSVTSKTVT